jgi:hypothetical protein
MDEGPFLIPTWNITPRRAHGDPPDTRRAPFRPLACSTACCRGPPYKAASTRPPWTIPYNSHGERL